jgi:hypothetical protein
MDELLTKLDNRKGALIIHKKDCISVILVWEFLYEKLKLYVKYSSKGVNKENLNEKLCYILFTTSWQTINDVESIVEEVLEWVIKNEPIGGNEILMNSELSSYDLWGNNDDSIDIEQLKEHASLMCEIALKDCNEFENMRYDI